MLRQNGMDIGQFQSTHPVRGATDTENQDKTMSRISIHAPREGCDTGRTCAWRQVRYFNPRTP